MGLGYVATDTSDDEKKKEKKNGGGGRLDVRRPSTTLSSSLSQCELKLRWAVFHLFVSSVLLSLLLSNLYLFIPPGAGLCSVHNTT